MKTTVLALILLLAIPDLALACKPCTKKLDWKQTAQKADVIVIGRQLHAGPDTKNGGPDWIDLKVDDELVGEAISEVVRVNGWDGKCEYGIELSNSEPHIVFLKKTNLARTKAHYSSVSKGCGTKAFAIVDDYVVIDRTRMPLSEFIAKSQALRK